jgi:hypothetical protein
MKTIYWSKFNLLSEVNSQIFDLEPKPVHSEYVKKFGKPLDSSINWLACPSVLGYTKNTFLIKNPLDLSVRINKNNTVDAKTPGSSMLLGIRDFNEKSIVIDYFINISLFSESNISVSQISPYMENNPCSGAHLIPGKFNIGEWFRPLNASYFLENKDVDFILKKDDPLYYLVFDTDDKIEFKEFYYTDSLIEIVNSTVGLKRYKKNIPLMNLYQMFKEQNLDKIVLKEIKKALI